jgi:hypothetical protein
MAQAKPVIGEVTPIEHIGPKTDVAVVVVGFSESSRGIFDGSVMMRERRSRKRQRIIVDRATGSQENSIPMLPPDPDVMRSITQ